MCGFVLSATVVLLILPGAALTAQTTTPEAESMKLAVFVGNSLDIPRQCLCDPPRSRREDDGLDLLGDARYLLPSWHLPGQGSVW